MIAAVIVIALLVYGIRKATGKAKLAQQNIEKGSQFLAENKHKEGVVETASGLQFLSLEKGDSEETPEARSTVRVHYHGTMLDGTVFDSSVERGQPIEFGLNQVIPGWTEGLQLMKKGEKARLFIPSNLAYGNQAVGNIEPGSLLIFDVELIAFS